MNYLDTRDLYTRKCELESLRDAVTEAWDELCDAVADPEREHEREALSAAHDSAVEEYGDDEAGELAELEELESELGSEFRHGETMIPVGDFEEYAEQFAGDIGAIDPRARWTLTCIDWERAARELSQDYTEVSYQGNSYYVRA